MDYLFQEKQARRILSVGELTEYLKGLLDNDRNLRSIWIRGEISNYKHHSSGHLYFTLKDESSAIKSVMFRSKAMYLAFRPENGLRVVVRGYVTIFPRDGMYQFYAEEIEPDGLGSLHLAFEQLKKRLEQEGLFDSSQKKTLPRFPRRLALVTSPTGAAVQDMLNILRRRYPKVHIIIVPVVVQGEEAPRQISEAITRLNEYTAAGGSELAIDAMIVGRGGGSLEELWAFNTESVARAIFDSKIPVISAVGHETDFTIADFVADLRAPTPSAAAELVVPDWQELFRHLENLSQRIYRGLRSQLQLQQNRLQLCLQRGVFTRPKDRINQLNQYLDNLERQLLVSIEKVVQSKGSQFSDLAGRLQVLSPLATLSRGYSLTLHSPDRSRVTSIQELAVGDQLTVLLVDGEAACTVNEIHTNKEVIDRGTRR